MLALAIAAVATAWSGYQAVRGAVHRPGRAPGPGYLPQYRNPQLERAERLNAQPADAFEEGTAARETADRYVRVTVLFALVLFLVAVAQRFRTQGARIGANAVAVGLLLYGLYTVSTLPRM